MKARGKLLAFRKAAPDGETLELSDEALLAACAVGESAALGVIYDRHNTSVYRFVSRIASGPGSDVEDLVQCTFIEVWKSSGRFRQHGSARSWIFGISANLVRHYVRSEIRRRTAMDGLSERPEQSAPSLGDKVVNAETVGRLQVALAELSHEQRVAFVLCDIEEMAGVEAARVLGVRSGTLWRRLHDARKNLRAKLEAGER